MDTLRLFFKSLALWFCVAFPFMLVGLAFANTAGLVAGLVLGLLWLVMLSRLQERRILRRFGVLGFNTSMDVRGEPALPLIHSYERVLAELPAGEVPKLRFFDDPYPQVWVLKAMGSSGTLLVSRAMLSLLSEEELRSFLKQAVLRARARGLVFQVLCSVIAEGLFRRAPKSWMHVLFSERTLNSTPGAQAPAGLSPLQGVAFAVIFALAKLFLQIGRLPETWRVEPDTALRSAMSKAACQAEFGGWVPHPGLSLLALIPVSKRQVVLPAEPGLW